MKLKSITLENFRLFKEPTIFEFKSLTILTGQNSSGKSTIFKALMLLQENLKAPNYLGRLTFDSNNHSLGDFKSIINSENLKEGKSEIKFSLGFDEINLSAVNKLKMVLVYDFENVEYSKNGVLKELTIDINEKHHFTVKRDNGQNFTLNIVFDNMIRFLSKNKLINFKDSQKENVLEGVISTKTLKDERDKLENKYKKLINILSDLNFEEQSKIGMNDIDDLIEQYQKSPILIQLEDVKKEIETLKISSKDADRIKVLEQDFDNQKRQKDELTNQVNSISKTLSELSKQIAHAHFQVFNKEKSNDTVFDFSIKNLEEITSTELEYLKNTHISAEPYDSKRLTDLINSINVPNVENRKALQKTYEELGLEIEYWYSKSDNRIEISALEELLKEYDRLYNDEVDVVQVAKNRLAILKSEIVELETQYRQVNFEIAINSCKDTLIKYIQDLLEFDKMSDREEALEYKLAITENNLENIEEELQKLYEERDIEYQGKLTNLDLTLKNLNEQKNRLIENLNIKKNEIINKIRNEQEKELLAFGQYIKHQVYDNFSDEIHLAYEQFINKINGKNKVLPIETKKSFFITSFLTSFEWKTTINEMFSFIDDIQISGFLENQEKWTEQLQEITTNHDSFNQILLDDDFWNEEKDTKFGFIRSDIEGQKSSNDEFENLESPQSRSHLNFVTKPLVLKDLYTQNVLSESIVEHINSITAQIQKQLSFSVIPADRGKQIRIHRTDNETLPLSKVLAIYDTLEEEQKNFVKKWLGNSKLNKDGELGFNIGDDLEIEYLEADYLKGYVIQGDTKTNIADLGLGIAQIIPIIIQTATALNKDTLIYIEEPGTHLHPNFHEILIEFMVDASNYKIDFVVETHSGILINSIHYELKSEKPILSKDNLNICFIEDSTLNNVAINHKNGIDRFYLDYWKNFYGKYTQKQRQEKNKLQSEKNFFSKKYIELKADIKCIVLSEDEDLSLIKELLWHSGFNKGKTEVRSYNGCGNLPAALELAKFIQERYTKTKIVIHRDRDYLHDDEVLEIKDKLIKKNIYHFITDGTDIESYFLHSKHIEVICNLSESEAESILNKALKKSFSISCDKFCAKEFGGKHKDKKSHLKDFIGKTVATNKRFIYGKEALDYLVSELRGKGNVISPSKHISVVALQNIAKKIWKIKSTIHD